MFLTPIVLAAAFGQAGKSAAAPKVKSKIEVFQEGTGPAAAVGDLITVDYTGRLKNNKIFDTSIPIKPEKGHAPLPFAVGTGLVIPGWDQALLGSKVGARFRVTIPPSLAYGPQGTPDGTIPGNSTLIFDVHVLSLIKKGTKQVIEIKEITPGAGPEVKDKDHVTMHYVGTFLNGQKFDSSRDAGRQPFTFQTGVGQVIKGFDLAVLGMKKGGRRSVTIPPDLGYGARSAGPIPPNSTLVFDIEILDIK